MKVLLVIFTICLSYILGEGTTKVIGKVYPKKYRSYINGKILINAAKYEKSTNPSVATSYTAFQLVGSNPKIEAGVPNSPYFPVDPGYDQTTRVKKVLPLEYPWSILRKKRSAVLNVSPVEKDDKKIEPKTTQVKTLKEITPIPTAAAAETTVKKSSSPKEVQEESKSTIKINTTKAKSATNNKEIKRAGSITAKKNNPVRKGKSQLKSKAAAKKNSGRVNRNSKLKPRGKGADAGAGRAKPEGKKNKLAKKPKGKRIAKKKDKTRQGNTQRNKKQKANLNKGRARKIPKGKPVQPTNKKGKPKGKLVQPTIRKGKPVQPTNRKGKPVQPTIRKGKPVQPTNRKGKPVQPTNRKGKPVQPTIRKDTRRLIAAEEALIEDYPYVVSIQKDEQHWCSGALLNERLVITTANCLWKANQISRMEVRAGSRHSNRGGQMANIQEVIKHPNWGLRKNPDCDVALLLLDKFIKFSDRVHAVDLPNRVMLPPFDDAWITSWGSERRDGVYDNFDSTTLQVYHASLIDREKCNNVTMRYSVVVTENFICLAQSGRQAPCTRDTGAPAVSDGILWGLASWGLRKLCGTERFPAVFSYVASHSNMEFIMNATHSLMSDKRQYPFADRYPSSLMKRN